ncbi:hypothetical protein JTB14_002985 [Gonioctena quinquepunctata]|nr:hypothetical protein JTB14_002985 [Gonioctena quinquepunctata]
MKNPIGITVLFLCILGICESQEKEERTFLDQFTPLLRIFREIVGVGVKRITESRENRQLLESEQKAMKEYTGRFPCDVNISKRSTVIPKTVHEVRPADIDIVGAMGDSITAGIGISASNILIGSIDDRGKSFAVGGQGTWRTYLTLPNILKEFNSNLFGYSYGASITIQRDSQFNVAEFGAVSKNMPYMAEVLVRRIKEDPRVDMKNHWKMITHMIGDNDFCSEICYYNNPYDALEKHRKDLIRVLRILRNNLPKTIVNIVPPPNLRVFTAMTDLPPTCIFTHSLYCPCIEGLLYRSKQAIFLDIMEKWQKIDIEVANMQEFDTNDFTVIPHMFITNYTFPTTAQGTIDYGYLSADCFHLSEKGHAKRKYLFRFEGTHW